MIRVKRTFLVRTIDLAIDDRGASDCLIFTGAFTGF